MVHIPQADPRQHDEHQLDLADIPHKDPFELFAEWYATAAEQEIADPNAFTLATADRNNMPDARILLFKGFDQNGLVFYTNTLSTKGQQLSANPQAAAVNLLTDNGWQELLPQNSLQVNSSSVLCQQGFHFRKKRIIVNKRIPVFARK